MMMKIIMFLTSGFAMFGCAVTLISCTHTDILGELRRPASTPISYEAPTKALANDPSYQDLEQIILTDKVSSIAELLSVLKLRFPKFFNEYTLMYNSLSLHGSSFVNPRAIVFGNSANLILTYNGDSKQKAFSELEIATFNVTDGYQFREINFVNEAGSKDSSVEPDEIAFRRKFVNVSKPNPAVCMQCHGPGEARPIWQPYFIWPGAYGSVDDDLFRLAGHVDKSIISSASRDVRIQGSDTELEGYRKFLSQRTKNPRYQVLPDQPVISARSSLSHYAYNSPENKGIIYDLTHRPNFALLMSFSEQMQRRLFKKVMGGSPSTQKLEILARELCRLPPPDDMNNPYVLFLQDANQHFPTDLIKENQALVTEDDGRLFDNFKGHIRMDYVKVDQSKNIGDIRKTFISSASDFAGAPPESELIEVLWRLGIDVDDFAYNLRRQKIFSDGSANFLLLRELVFDELRHRGLNVTTLKCH